MAQHDYTIANQTASDARTDINNVLEAIATNNSGTGVPTATFPNQWFYDTSNQLLKIRNNTTTSYLNVGYIDQTNGFEILDDTQVVSTSGVTTGVIGDQAIGTWETGTVATESLVSPAKVAASATKVVSDYAVGVDQTWQDLTTSRAIGTTYQNNTGRPISVQILGGSGGGGSTWFEVSTNNFSSYVTIGGTKDHDGHSQMGGIIPSSHYYRMRVISNSFTLIKWAELR